MSFTSRSLLYPKGTYKTQQFYFRGDDIHHEPEFFDQEYRLVKEKYLKIQEEFENEKKNYENLNKELSKKDGYTIALASALGDGSSSTEQNSKLRNELNEYTNNIEKLEEIIKEIKNQIHPSLISNLNKEKAFYHAEIEHLHITIKENQKNIQLIKEDMINIVISEKFYKSHIIISEFYSFKRILNQIKNELDNTFNKFNNTQNNSKKNRFSMDLIPPGFLILFNKKTEAILERDKLIRIKEFLNLRTQSTSKVLIDQIETMNQVLVSLGGEIFDIEGMRNLFLIPLKNSSRISSRNNNKNLSKTINFQNKKKINNRPSTSFTRR